MATKEAVRVAGTATETEKRRESSRAVADAVAVAVAVAVPAPVLRGCGLFGQDRLPLQRPTPAL